MNEKITLHESRDGFKIKVAGFNVESFVLWIMDDADVGIPVLVSKQEWEMIKSTVDRLFKDQEQ